MSRVAPNEFTAQDCSFQSTGLKLGVPGPLLLLNNWGALDVYVLVFSSLDGGVEGVEVAYLDYKIPSVVMLPDSFIISEEGFDREMGKMTNWTHSLCKHNSSPVPTSGDISVRNI